jgi:Protein of unknown function (DUF3237)
MSASPTPNCATSTGSTPSSKPRSTSVRPRRATGASFRSPAATQWALTSTQSCCRSAAPTGRSRRPSGSSVADIRYTLKTNRGALLYVQSRGVRHGDPNVVARLAAGEDVDPSEYTFRASVTIETADAELAWVNQRRCLIAVGGRRPSGVSYDVYLVA